MRRLSQIIDPSDKRYSEISRIIDIIYWVAVIFGFIFGSGITMFFFHIGVF